MNHNNSKQLTPDDRKLQQIRKKMVRVNGSSIGDGIEGPKLQKIEKAVTQWSFSLKHKLNVRKQKYTKSILTGKLFLSKCAKIESASCSVTFNTRTTCACFKRGFIHVHNTVVK